MKNHRQFKGLLDVYKKTLSSDGIAGLYRGFGVSITGITLYRGLYFGIYDTLKPIVLVGPLEVIIEPTPKLKMSVFDVYLDMFIPPFCCALLDITIAQGNFFPSFILGWCVTTFSGICAYPFDTLRRRMMLTSGQTCKYTSALQAFKHIVRQEGFSALFRGVTANVLSGMAGAGVLAGYDQLQQFASKHGSSFGFPLRGDLK